MLGVLFLILFYFLINQGIFGYYEKKHRFFSKKKMNLLYLYHLVFFGIYLWYAYNNPSDSKQYYEFLQFYSGDWLGTFGTDTKAINFLSYPFYQLGMNYDMLMLTFSWLGFIGFIYAYMFFRENIPIKIKIFNIDFLTLLLFLPNMHFWTASLGKGAPIFMGVMMFTYGILRPQSRLFVLILGSLIVFYIRPHVFMFLAVGAILGYMSGKEKISFGKKIFIFTALIGTLVVAQEQILGVVNLEGTDNLVEGFQDFSEERSEGLSEAGSGVDMTSYPLPIKLLTFWFRPLFVDAPNVLGIMVSFENLLYLILFLKILKKDFIKFIRKSPSVIKMSLVIFLLTSFAMTFVMSNLGIIMRQKQMVMYFLFFVIYYYLAQKKYIKILRLRKQRIRREQEQEKNEQMMSV